ncbi:MAG: hypothetical protein KBS66_04760 [Eubacterium sp.]|nr:hypothetical protein [Candidatus Colimonas fimequi]
MNNVPWLEGRDCVRIEFNTPVSHDDKRGWFNLVTWENCFVADSPARDIPVNTAVRAVVSFMKGEEGASFSVWNEKDDAPFLSARFDKTGDIGQPPIDPDDEGTFYYSKINGKITCYFKPVEIINDNKEICDTIFRWDNVLAASAPKKYRHVPMICTINAEEMLDSYCVKFTRTVPEDRYEKIMGE